MHAKRQTTAFPESKHQLRVIDDDEEIQVMEKGAQLRTMELRELHEFQQQLGKANIGISFEQVADVTCKMNFIAPPCKYDFLFS